MSGRAKRPRADNTWTVQDVGSRFEEVIRRARSDGPQYVLRGGRRTVAIVDAAELDRLKGSTRGDLVPFLESLHLEGLDLTRDGGDERESDL